MHGVEVGLMFSMASVTCFCTSKRLLDVVWLNYPVLNPSSYGQVIHVSVLARRRLLTQQQKQESPSKSFPCVNSGLWMGSAGIFESILHSYPAGRQSPTHMKMIPVFTHIASQFPEGLYETERQASDVMHETSALKVTAHKIELESTRSCNPKTQYFMERTAFWAQK